MQTFTTFLAVLAAGTAFAAPTVYQNKPSYGVDHLVKVSLYIEPASVKYAYTATV